MEHSGVRPAFSADEWEKFLALGERLPAMLRELLATSPFSAHGLAALLLRGQPFGFTQQDDDDERQVADYCEKMERDSTAIGDQRSAELFRMLGPRHRDRADRIAALLPPAQAS